MLPSSRPLLRAIGPPGAAGPAARALFFSLSSSSRARTHNTHTLTLPPSLPLYHALSLSPPPTDGKTFKKPRRPFEKERLDAEMKTVGEYGLRNKRELWRVQMALSKIRQAARTLLTLDDKDSRRLFEGEALLRRMYRYGVLDEAQNKLDYVLALTPADFLERRLQTLVFKLGLAKSVHHARVLIRQRHVRVGKQVVNVPSFMVRVDAQKHIDFALHSPFGGGRPGRNKRKAVAAKKARKAGGGGGGGEEEVAEAEEEE